MSLQPPHGSCSFSLSSPRPCSDGRGMGEWKEQPILDQNPSADTPGGDHFCHRLLTDEDLFPLTALQV